MPSTIQRPPSADPAAPAAAPASPSAVPAPSGGRAAALGRLGRNSLAYAAVSAGHAAIGVLLLPMYTRLLPPAQYGQLALITSLGTFLQVVLALAVHVPALRLYFECRGDPARLRRLWGTLLTFAIAAPLAGAALLTLAGEPLLRPFLADVPFWPLCVLGIAAAALQPAIDVVLAIAMAREQPIAYGSLLLGQLVLKALLAVVLAGACGLGLGGVLAGNTVAAAIVLAAATLAIRRTAPPCLDRPTLRSALGYSLPLVPHLLANQSRLLLDRTVLAHLIGTFAVGAYVVALQIATVVNVLMTAITRAWQPTFMRVVTGDDERQVHGLADLGLLMAGLACAAASAVALAGPELMQLLVSARFRAGALLVHPLVFGFAALALQQQFVQALYLRPGRTKRVAMASLLTLASSVAMNLLLVPVLGMAGATVSALVVQVLAAIVVAALAHRESPVRWPYGRLAAMFVLAAVGSAWPIVVVPPLCVATVVAKLATWTAIVVGLAAVAWNDPRRGYAKLRKAVALTLTFRRGGEVTPPVP